MRRTLTVFPNHTVDGIPLENHNRYTSPVGGEIAGSMVGSERAHVFQARYLFL